jgi:hypothetical protein
LVQLVDRSLLQSSLGSSCILQVLRMNIDIERIGNASCNTLVLSQSIGRTSRDKRWVRPSGYSPKTPILEDRSIERVDGGTRGQPSRCRSVILSRVAPCGQRPVDAAYPVFRRGVWISRVEMGEVKVIHIIKKWRRKVTPFLLGGAVPLWKSAPDTASSTQIVKS